MKESRFIRSYALFTSLVVTVIGIGIFDFPRKITNDLGSSGWLITILSGLIGFFLMYVIFLVSKKNNYANYFDILNNNLGKVLGAIVGITYIIFTVININIGIRTFAEVLKVYLLKRTPTQFIVATMILVGIYLIRGGVRSIVNFNQIAFWLMFIPILIVVPFTISGADFSNLLPITTSKPINYLKSMWDISYSFIGIEILFFLAPFMENKKYINKTIVFAMLFITMFYVFITIFVIAVFSNQETKTLLWPTITMMTSIDIKGTFIERWQGIVMAIWVIFYFTTFSNLYYCSSKLLNDIFNVNSIKITSFILMPFIYIGSIYPDNIVDLLRISSKILKPLTIINIAIIPIILLIISMIKQKRRNKNEN